MLLLPFVLASPASYADIATCSVFSNQAYAGESNNLTSLSTGVNGCDSWTRVAVFKKLATYAEAWKRNKKIVIAFRGSNQLENFITNGDSKQVRCRIADSCGLVHRGFQADYLKLRQKLKDFVAKESFDSILVTGHSLGGALATLLALDIYPLTKFKLSLITFGSPRVGNLEFVNAFKNLKISSSRIVNVQPLGRGLVAAKVDIVTTIPKDEYLHVTDATNMTSTEVVDTLDLHKMTRYQTRVLQKIQISKC